MRKISIESTPSIQDARHAIVTAIQTLRFTQTSKLADIYEILYDHRIENARVAIHADMYAKMFEMILKATDEKEDKRGDAP